MCRQYLDWLVWMILLCGFQPLKGTAQVAKVNPVLSGEWELVETESSENLRSDEVFKLLIEQHGDELKIAHLGGTNQSDVFYMNGRGETNVVKVRLNYAPFEEDDNERLNSKTKWSGNKLVSRGTRNLNAHRDNIKIEMVVKWSLSVDGQTLTRWAKATFYRTDMPSQLSQSVMVGSGGKEIRITPKPMESKAVFRRLLKQP